MMEKSRTRSENLPIVLSLDHQGNKMVVNGAAPLRAGDLCPVCMSDQLEYNGLLNLECGECKYTVGGCFT